MRLRRAALANVFGLTVVLAPSLAFAGDPAAAREQLKAGYTLAQDGKCAEAIPRFVESARLDAKAITLINLASCEEKTGRLADALGHWVEARARAQSEGNAAIEGEAEKRAKALEPRIPRLNVVIDATVPKDAEIVRDGVVLGSVSVGVPLPVNAGAHTIVVRATGFQDSTKTVEVVDGETKRVEVGVGAKKAAVAVPPKAPSRDNNGKSTSPLVYAGFGTALVGIGVGAVTGIMALGKASNAKDACPDLACRNQGALDDVESGRTLGTISTIGFIVGGVGAAVGVYGLISGGKKSDAPAVAVTVGPFGGGLRGSF